MTYFKDSYLIARVASAYFNDSKASPKLFLLGSTTNNASYVSTHALIQLAKLAAASETFDNLSFA